MNYLPAVLAILAVSYMRGYDAGTESAVRKGWSGALKQAGCSAGSSSAA